jgi:hypothetical protein
MPERVGSDPVHYGVGAGSDYHAFRTVGIQHDPRLTLTLLLSDECLRLDQRRPLSIP